MRRKSRICLKFCPLAIDIQHIGSTSVEGLDAKPIIDIAVGLKKLSDFEKIRYFFKRLLQYSIKIDNDPGELLARKGPDNNRTHFIQVMKYKDQRMNDSLKFRDILRSHSQLSCAESYFINIKVNIHCRSNIGKVLIHRTSYPSASSFFFSSIILSSRSTSSATFHLSRHLKSYAPSGDLYFMMVILFRLLDSCFLCSVIFRLCSSQIVSYLTA